MTQQKKNKMKTQSVLIHQSIIDVKTYNNKVGEIKRDRCQVPQGERIYIKHRMVNYF